MRKILSFLGAIYFATTATAFAGSSNGAGFTGKYVFDCAHVNWAWGYRMRGFYIDSKGNIFKYERINDPWRPKEAGKGPDAELEERELSDKYKNRQLVGKLPSNILKEKSDKIYAASKGEITRLHRAYDAGAYSCEAYMYDENAERYSVVRLGTIGIADWEERNSAPEARKLLEWLKSVQKKYLKSHNGGRTKNG